MKYRALKQCSLPYFTVITLLKSSGLLYIYCYVMFFSISKFNTLWILNYVDDFGFVMKLLIHCNSLLAGRHYSSVICILPHQLSITNTSVWITSPGYLRDLVIKCRVCINILWGIIEITRVTCNYRNRWLSSSPYGGRSIVAFRWDGILRFLPLYRNSLLFCLQLSTEMFSPTIIYFEGFNLFAKQGLHFVNFTGRNTCETFYWVLSTFLLIILLL